MDDFEQRLRDQPMRNVPDDWRVEILGGARAAASRRPPVCERPSFLSTLNAQLSSLLWPSPKAWAGVAAAWMAIFVFNFLARETSQPLAMHTTPPSRAFVELVKEQRRELLALAGLAVSTDADKPKPRLPGPHSELKDDWALT